MTAALKEKYITGQIQVGPMLYTLVWHGIVWHGIVWHGKAWCVLLWYDQARPSNSFAF